MKHEKGSRRSDHCEQMCSNFQKAFVWFGFLYSDSNHSRLSAFLTHIKKERGKERESKRCTTKNTFLSLTDVLLNREQFWFDLHNNGQMTRLYVVNQHEFVWVCVYVHSSRVDFFYVCPNQK